MKNTNLLFNLLLFAMTILLAIFLGSQLPKLIRHSQDPFRHGDFSAHTVNQPYKLTLYGTSSCPHCASARSFLWQAGIPFNDRVVDKSDAAKAAFKQLNESGVPVIVSEHELLVGFNQAAYEAFIRTVKAK